MKKTLFILLLLAITLTITGCKPMEISCEDDGVMVPFYGKDDRTFRGFDIGRLNQCNDNITSAANYEDLLTEESYFEDLDVNPSLSEARLSLTTHYVNIFDTENITPDDLESTNVFDQVKGSINSYIHEPYINKIDAPEGNEPFEHDTLLGTYTWYQEDNYYYELFQSGEELTQKRMYLLENDYIIDSFSYDTSEGIEQITYSIFQESVGYFEFSMLKSLSETRKMVTVSMNSYDIVTSEYYEISYVRFSSPNEEDGHHFIEINYYNEQEQLDYSYARTMNTDGSVDSKYLNLSFYTDNNLELTYSDIIDGRDPNSCGIPLGCSAYIVSYNLAFISNWDHILKITSSDYVLQDSQGNDLLDTSLTSDTKNAFLNFNLSTTWETTSIVKVLPELTLRTASPISESLFETPINGLSYTGSYTLSDVSSTFYDYADDLSEQFDVTSSTVTIFNEDYQLSNLMEWYRSFIPEEFSDYIDENTVFTE